MTTSFLVVCVFYLSIQVLATDTDHRKRSSFFIPITYADEVAYQRLQIKQHGKRATAVTDKFTKRKNPDMRKHPRDKAQNGRGAGDNPNRV